MIVMLFLAGAAVGLILPETVSASDRNLFEGMLGSLTIMNNEETTLLESDIDLPQQLIPLEIHSEPMIPTIPETEVQEKERTSTKISKGIIVGEFPFENNHNWIKMDVMYFPLHDWLILCLF